MISVRLVVTSVLLPKKGLEEIKGAISNKPN